MATFDSPIDIMRFIEKFSALIDPAFNRITNKILNGNPPNQVLMDMYLQRAVFQIVFENTSDIIDNEEETKKLYDEMCNQDNILDNIIDPEFVSLVNELKEVVLKYTDKEDAVKYLMMLFSMYKNYDYEDDEDYEDNEDDEDNESNESFIESDTDESDNSNELDDLE